MVVLDKRLPWISFIQKELAHHLPYVGSFLKCVCCRLLRCSGYNLITKGYEEGFLFHWERWERCQWVQSSTQLFLFRNFFLNVVIVHKKSEAVMCRFVQRLDSSLAWCQCKWLKHATQLHQFSVFQRPRVAKETEALLGALCNVYGKNLTGQQHVPIWSE